MYFVFLFRQKTSYEMRISDWSSDVCSSDLLVEPLSLDEAYLDVSENKRGLASATEVAQQIRREIREQLQLTASAGVAPNKFVAKIASDWKKPDGLFVVRSEEHTSELQSLMRSSYAVFCLKKKKTNNK